MLISDIIANMIEDLLEEQGGTLEIGRNELASKVGCVPSQINYVITSRFTPEKGYVIESRRGAAAICASSKKMSQTTRISCMCSPLSAGRLTRAARVPFAAACMKTACLTRAGSSCRQRRCQPARWPMCRHNIKISFVRTYSDRSSCR